MNMKRPVTALFINSFNVLLLTMRGDIGLLSQD